MRCKGFLAGGTAAGLKKKGGMDLGIIFSEVSAAGAAVFTRNRVQAAPVVLDRERIRSGICRAVIVNSGNANCCTGGRGLTDAAAMARAAAVALEIPEELVLVASTGVIGQFLPIEKVEAAVPGLVSSLRPDGFDDLAQAIMTTDKMPKLVSREGRIGDRSFTLLGVAKGSGMIRPDMATMLCFVCTDAGVPADFLETALRSAADRSFNRITVDGDTSTNDTIIVMANGLSGAAVNDAVSRDTFGRLLEEVLIDLAKRVVKDGEGATKLVEIAVRGAASDGEAHAVADTIANSSLVKTALFGEDANWGRILAAAGRAGVAFDPERVDIFFEDVLMFRNGAGFGEAVEAAATAVLKKPEFAISVDLHSGEGAASVFTCDFSLDYVRINADYRS